MRKNALVQFRVMLVFRLCSAALQIYILDGNDSPLVVTAVMGFPR
jgi:hypothetical protein